MSYHLGISHFPVLHRQLTSPTIEKFPELPEDDFTQDSKDVLIDRLNDLVLRLSNVKSLKDSAVSAIHREVDKIEALVNGVEKTNSPRELKRQQSGYLNDDRDIHDFWGPPTPTQNIKMRIPAISQNSSPRIVFESVASKADKVAKAAEELSAKLSSTVAQLLDRREESDVSILCRIVSKRSDG